MSGTSNLAVRDLATKILRESHDNNEEMAYQKRISAQMQLRLAEEARRLNPQRRHPHTDRTIGSYHAEPDFMHPNRHLLTRRGVLGVGFGLGATAFLAGRAQANTPFTSFGYPTTSGSVNRTTPQRFNDIINVREFGATGDGSTNDGPAMQSAMDAAFGAWQSPNGLVGKYNNKPLFIPSGNYRIVGGLYVSGVQGGLIFGDGGDGTALSFEPGTDGNPFWPEFTASCSGTTLTITAIVGVGYIFPGAGTVYTGTGVTDFRIIKAIGGSGGTGTYEINISQTFGSRTVTTQGSEINPGLMMNGCAYMEVGNFTVGSNSSTNSVGIFSMSNGQYFSSAIRFHNILYAGWLTGHLGGYGGNIGGNDDNFHFFQCSFSLCTLAGLRQGHQNALNYSVYGGGGTSCAATSTGLFGNKGALYSAVTCAISPICAISVSGNTLDMCNGSSGGCTIISGSSESLESFQTGASGLVVSSFNFRNDPSTNAVAIWAPSSNVYVQTTLFNYGTALGDSVLVDVDNSGVAILDGVYSGPGSVDIKIEGSAGSQVSIRGCSPFAGSDWLENYTGQVIELNGAFPGWKPGPVSDLPTAHAKYKGIRQVVTDAAATTFGTTAAGSGANTMGVICDGTVWKYG